jgi:hypothetical protein
MTHIALYGHQIANEHLRNMLRYGRFDAVVYIPFIGKEIDPLTWSHRPKHTKSILYMFNDDWRFDSFSAEACWYFDIVATDYEPAVDRYHTINYPGTVIHTHRTCRPEWFGWGANKNRNIDVSFVGQFYRDRAQHVDAILSRLSPDYTCYSAGTGRGRVSWIKYVHTATHSKIMLCPSHASTGDSLQVKVRHFEAVAAGALMLTDNPVIDRYFSVGSECGIYGSVDDAVATIKYFLRNDQARDGVVSAAGDRMLREGYANRRHFEILMGAVCRL